MKGVSTEAPLISGMNLELNQSATIDATPEAVFGVLSDVEGWPRFNPKIANLNAEGELFAGQLEFRGRSMDFTGEVVTNERPRAIGARMVIDDQGKQYLMRVDYTIEPRGAKSHVSEKITYDIELPWLAAMLVKFLQRFGKATGPTALDRLKEIVESGVR